MPECTCCPQKLPAHLHSWLDYGAPETPMQLKATYVAELTLSLELSFGLS